jgi:hypothetical protein
MTGKSAQQVRNWRWSLCDLIVGLAGIWFVVDRASVSSLAFFATLNLVLAGVSVVGKGQLWVHPTVWELPLLLVGNVAILAFPLVVLIVQDSPERVVIALSVLIGSRIAIWLAPGHLG